MQLSSQDRPPGSPFISLVEKHQNFLLIYEVQILPSGVLYRPSCCLFLSSEQPLNAPKGHSRLYSAPRNRERYWTAYQAVHVHLRLCARGMHYTRNTSAERSTLQSSGRGLVVSLMR